VDQLLTSELYGLESARPPALDALMREREAILQQPGDLSDADKQRLDELAAEIEELPMGETASDIEAMNIVRRAARHLRDAS
jgi:hypothetical protein